MSALSTVNVFELAIGELLTVRDWFRFAISEFNRNNLFFGHGTDNANDEAAYLILHTLQLPLEQLTPFLDAKLLPHERADLATILQRRIDARLPAPYLTHQAWLQGYEFYVDERVIIPRSYLAEILVSTEKEWLTTQPQRILDLCTGNGSLAIIAASLFDSASVDAAELSMDAMVVAAQNVAEYNLGNRVTVVQSDLLSGLTGQQYDLILCNPPYVNQMSMDSLPAEYHHEPELALAGGDDGMDLVALILEQWEQYATPNGQLLLEIGNEQANFEARFADQLANWHYQWLPVSETGYGVLLFNRHAT
jgi:ribosomal protein L3 glutamine methyltransferase